MEVARSAARSFGVWFNARPFVVQGFVAGILFGLALSIAVLLLTGLGQMWALGPAAAWSLYRWSWLQTGAKVVVTVTAASCTITLGLALAVWISDNAGALTRKLIVGALYSVLVGVAAFAFVAAGHDEAVRRYGEARTTGQADNAGQLLQTQRQNLGQASANATQLLASLEATEGEVRAAKDRLRVTLSALQEQRQAIDSSASTLEQVLNRQQVVALQLTALQNALGGQQPITRADLEASQRSGLIQGTILGIVTSMVATFLYNVGTGITARRRKAITPDATKAHKDDDQPAL